MNHDFNLIIENIQKKLFDLEKKSSIIKKKFNQDNFNINNDKLNLFYKISSNINELNDQINELYMYSLDTVDSDDLTVDEKKVLRENKINQIINKKFMPYIIFSKICLENSEF